MSENEDREFTVVMVATDMHGERKFLFGVGSQRRRESMLKREGYTDIVVAGLPKPMKKAEALGWAVLNIKMPETDGAEEEEQGPVTAGIVAECIEDFMVNDLHGVCVEYGLWGPDGEATVNPDGSATLVVSEAEPDCGGRTPEGSPRKRFRITVQEITDGSEA